MTYLSPIRPVAVALLLAALSGSAAAAQAKPKSDSAKAAKKEAGDSTKKMSAATAANVERFWSTAAPVNATLTVNIKRVRGDKDDKAPWRAATVTVQDTNGKPVTMPVKVKTHGIWRLNHCEFPPLTVNFAGATTKGTVFHGLDKPRLTSYCRNNDGYEQYVIQELQLYRIYHLLSPASHAARLLHVTYTDSATGKVEATRYAFVIEGRDELAARLKGQWLKQKGAGPSDLQPLNSAIVGLFQFLIGNTDWGISTLHNTELLGDQQGEVTVVAFDFDYAGAVNARYATPDPRFLVGSGCAVSSCIRAVRDRLFRGFCVPDADFQRGIALFNQKKDAIYALYADTVGKLLKPDIVKDTREYFDDFYKIINNPRDLKREVLEVCLGRK
jgi:hypothetical protein